MEDLMANAEQTEITAPIEGTTPVSGLSSYTPLQQMLLTRYARLDALRRQEIENLEPSDWHARLIHKALYSTYLDCEEAGVGVEARLFGAREKN
jgi:hypothetical protein